VTGVLDPRNLAAGADADPGPAKPRKPRALQYAALVVALVITVVVYLLRDRLADFAQYGYLGIFLISMLGNATIILPVPTFLTAFLGGGVFNPILVGVISAAGATIGELTGYLAGVGGKAIVEDRALYERFRGWMERYGLFALFAMAAIPNPFFDIAGIIAGVSRIKVTTYLAVTWAGKIVKFILIALVGAGSVNLLDLFD